ncbi:MAG: hypothetical protein HN548_10670, partial [Opitutae bacterium]|nr:hypothetical protein [Opitutae bacterium]
MTISISKKSLLFILTTLCVFMVNPRSINALPSSTTRVPQDSFFIISISLNSVLKKSQLVESRVWKPIVDTLTLTNPQLTSLLLEPVQNGFNSRTPIQIFLRSSNLGTNPLQFGLLASIENTEKMDIT